MMLKSKLGMPNFLQCGKTASDDRIGLGISGLAVMLAIVVVMVAMIPVGGCAQNTENALAQPSKQAPDTPSTTTNENAQDGAEVNIYVINSPHGDEMPSDGQDPFLELVTTGDGEGDPATLGEVSEGLSGLKTASATYAQGGISITVSTGDTPQSATGTTSPSVINTQQPGATQTQTPTMTVSPELAAMLQAAFSPGGINDFAGSASGGSGSAGLDKTSNNQLRQAWLQALKDDPSLIADFLGLAKEAIGDTPADVGSNGTR